MESKDSKDQGKDTLQCLNAMLAKMQRIVYILVRH